MDVEILEQGVGLDSEESDVDARDPEPPVGQPTAAASADKDEEDGYEEPFPEDRKAGATYGPSKTTFERIRDDQILTGCEVLGPFADEEEWELAKWLIKNVGHNQTEAFLKLPIVSCLDRATEDLNSAHIRSRSQIVSDHPSTISGHSWTQLTIYPLVPTGILTRSHSPAIFWMTTESFGQRPQSFGSEILSSV